MCIYNICSSGAVVFALHAHVRLYVERKVSIDTYLHMYAPVDRPPTPAADRFSHSQIDRFRHKNKYYLLVIYLIREKIQHWNRAIKIIYLHFDSRG